MRINQRQSYLSTVPSALMRQGNFSEINRTIFKVQTFAINDVHTFNPAWLNELRVGYRKIDFFMTSIDYGANLAEHLGVPGVNLNDVSSALNQPLITNLGNVQIFDSVTHIRGRQTFILPDRRP